MKTHTLPGIEEMTTAFLAGDSSYEGVFVTAVKTTGIFCRPGCPARKPRPENIQFFPDAYDALHAGYRPCKRCSPMEALGQQPEWVERLLKEIDHNPVRRWRDQDLRELGLSPVRVRRWFKEHHGMTFHAYSRARRLGEFVGPLSNGASVTDAAFESGYESLSGFNHAFRKHIGSAPTRTSGLTLKVNRIASPLGPMIAAASDQHLYLLEFADRRALPRQLETLSKRTSCVLLPGSNEITERLNEELNHYFRTGDPSFSIGMEYPGTDFQRSVWNALRDIPAGETRSYKDIARAIGRDTAVRAVARANGDNRLAILIPCHRVVGADGSLTGYGGGLWRKKRLLELEGAA